jgi:hypothetical protein
VGHIDMWIADCVPAVISVIPSGAKSIYVVLVSGNSSCEFAVHLFSLPQMSQTIFSTELPDVWPRA